MTNSIILITFIIFLTACSNPSKGGDSQHILGEKCEGYMATSWINKTTDNVYDFKANCTGSITSCEATFNYDPVSQSQVYIEVLTSNNQSGCPLQGTKGYCDYHIKDTAGIVQSMVMNCDNQEVIYVPVSGQ